MAMAPCVSPPLGLSGRDESHLVSSGCLRSTWATEAASSLLGPRGERSHLDRAPGATNSLTGQASLPKEKREADGSRPRQQVAGSDPLPDCSAELSQSLLWCCGWSGSLPRSCGVLVARIELVFCGTHVSRLLTDSVPFDWNLPGQGGAQVSRIGGFLGEEGQGGTEAKPADIWASDRVHGCGLLGGSILAIWTPTPY